MSDEPAKYTRLGVNINLEAAAVLKDVSVKRGDTITQTVNRAVAILKFIEDANTDGRKVLVEDENGKLRELVLL